MNRLICLGICVSFLGCGQSDSQPPKTHQPPDVNGNHFQPQVPAIPVVTQEEMDRWGLDSTRFEVKAELDREKHSDHASRTKPPQEKFAQQQPQDEFDIVEAILKSYRQQPSKP